MTINLQTSNSGGPSKFEEFDYVLNTEKPHGTIDVINITEITKLAFQDIPNPPPPTLKLQILAKKDNKNYNYFLNP